MAASMGRVSSSRDEGNSSESETSKPKVNRYNWLLEHPKYVEMKSWGFIENEQQLFVTMIVYLNLCEAKDWRNVDIHPCRELSLAFLTGKPSRKEDMRVVLPITPETELSPKRLKELLRYIRPPPDLLASCVLGDSDTASQQEAPPTSLILAIAESGSTIVYYQISDGLVPPSDTPIEEDDESESSGKSSTKPPRKRRKKGGPPGVQETVTEYANEGVEQQPCQDDFIQEEL